MPSEKPETDSFLAFIEKKITALHVQARAPCAAFNRTERVSTLKH